MTSIRTLLLSALAASAMTVATQAQTVLRSGPLEMRIEPRPFRFAFFVAGKQVVGEDAASGILIASEPAFVARPAQCSGGTGPENETPRENDPGALRLQSVCAQRRSPKMRSSIRNRLMKSR